jgi:pimeloyl-ACP methyl ester carboxylesterase
MVSHAPRRRINSVSFHLPPPSAVLDLTMSDGAIIHVRRHGSRDGPRLLLSHGNGFAIDAYYPFWRHFLHDCEVIVFDQRNHGWNPRHHQRAHTERQMADDMQLIIKAIVDVFGERRTVGAFHSLSTTVSLLHAMAYEFPWHTLLLFDPPLAPPRGHPLHALACNFELGLSNWARQRPRAFSRVDDLALYFKSSRRLRRWVPGAAELMARATTRSAKAGGVELVCPPEFEAQIYVENAQAPVWPVLAKIAASLLVVSSDYDAPDADPPGLVSKALQSELGIEVVKIADSGHLLQIEQPGHVQKLVRARLRARGFAIAAA